jgi:hypothetical protein
MCFILIASLPFDVRFIRIYYLLFDHKTYAMCFLSSVIL